MEPISQKRIYGSGSWLEEEHLPYTFAWIVDSDHGLFIYTSRLFNTANPESTRTDWDSEEMPGIYAAVGQSRR